MKTDSFKRWRKWGHINSETLIMNVFFNHLFGFTFLSRVANCKEPPSKLPISVHSFLTCVTTLYLSFLSKLFISLCLSISIFVFSLCICLTFSLWLLECYFFDLSLFLFFPYEKFAFDEYHLIFLILDS
jgi:hypothetical protein